MKTIDSHPKKLGREPLLEVIFEFRFSAKISATNILPAVFLKPSNGSNENFKIDKLPSSEIPEFIRNQDPNLKYTPLLKIDRKDFNYFIGDNSYGIACKIPYVGWEEFSREIYTSMESLRELHIIDNVERFSLKYVDLLEIDEIEEQYEAIDIKINFNEQVLKNTQYNLRLSINENGFNHILQIVLGAEISVANTKIFEKKGLILDIDTIKTLDMPIDDFYKKFSGFLESMHTASKKQFFALLSNKGLESLEPIYD